MPINLQTIKLRREVGWYWLAVAVDREVNEHLESILAIMYKIGHLHEVLLDDLTY
jgi:hypothetical protein